jgi:hypothetical protein
VRRFSYKWNIKVEAALKIKVENEDDGYQVTYNILNRHTPF